MGLEYGVWGSNSLNANLLCKLTLVWIYAPFNIMEVHKIEF